MPDVRPAIADDIDAIKRLADAHRSELGFVVRASLVDSCRRGGLFVASIVPSGATQPAPQIVGFAQAHFRRDGQVTLHTIAVAPAHRRLGIGRAIVGALIDAARGRQMHCILLRCPADLTANSFYAALGFRRERIEPGKHRKLSVWVSEVQPFQPHHHPI